MASHQQTEATSLKLKEERTAKPEFGTESTQEVVVVPFKRKRSFWLYNSLTVAVLLYSLGQVPSSSGCVLCGIIPAPFPVWHYPRMAQGLPGNHEVPPELFRPQVQLVLAEERRLLWSVNAFVGVLE